MKANLRQYLFWFFSLFLLVMMIVMSLDAGISCDEVLHYNHSRDVWSFFSSDGENTNAINTPVTHLQYYGQSYDNIVTLLAEWFGVEDVYTFRHVMSAIAGWSTIIVTALFALWLTNNYWTALLVLILFAVSPTFIGHSLNNLKDIPFALSYIASLFFMARLFHGEKQFAYSDALLLTISIAFSISVRIGGLVLICYLYLFLLIWIFLNYRKRESTFFGEMRKRAVVVVGCSVVAYFLGILLWPYALQAPFANVIESHNVMSSFPDTFRQLFQGEVMWSDLMPWYYLPKSMLITIPLVVTIGLLIFCSFYRRVIRDERRMVHAMLLFAIAFPILLVIVTHANLYSSWRQFLFVYPCIIMLSALGLMFLIEKVKQNTVKLVVCTLFVIALLHPIRYMVADHPYEYIYYNQLVGGVRGAFGNYELDYYYVSQTEASEWLIDYFKKHDITTAKVKATYSVSWQFRNMPGVETSYFRNEERSMYDWDYAIITNRYVSPERLKDNRWPPHNVIHEVYVEGVPVCAVLERRDDSDYKGYVALERGDNKEAIEFFSESVEYDDDDEMIFYNFARALYNDGQRVKAVSMLNECLRINDSFEPALMYLGNIAVFEGKREEAMSYYGRLISVNRKYFEAYVKLAELTGEEDVQEAKAILRRCLKVNPSYQPAIEALIALNEKRD